MRGEKRWFQHKPLELPDLLLWQKYEAHTPWHEIEIDTSTWIIFIFPHVPGQGFRLVIPDKPSQPKRSYLLHSRQQDSRRASGSWCQTWTGTTLFQTGRLSQCPPLIVMVMVMVMEVVTDLMIDYWWFHGLWWWWCQKWNLMGFDDKKEDSPVHTGRDQ